MDIAALKTILLIQAHGSLAGAARALELDASSISRTLAAVEAELGIRLFHRTTRRLTATEEGELYLSRLAPLIEEIEAAREDAAGRRSKPAGLLRMTASVAFSCEMIVPILPDFQTRYPDITVDLQSSDANLDLIENGIDLAIRLAPAPKGDLVSTRLVSTEYKVVASPGYLRGQGAPGDPLALENLNCLRYSLPNIQNKWRFQRADDVPFDVDIDGSPMISNALALRNAARLGLGVALLADWLIKDDLLDGQLVEILPDYKATLSDFQTAAWGLYPSRRYLPRKVRVMIDYLRSSLTSGAS